MRIRMFPTREGLSNWLKGERFGGLRGWEFFVWIFLFVNTIYLPHAIYKKWWPWMMRNAAVALSDASSDSEIRLFDIIIDNLQGVYYPHARKLLSYEASGIAAEVINLKDMADLPGADDAFWIDFSRTTGRCRRGSLPVDTLLAQLNPAPTRARKFGGAAQLMRRTVGGLVRFVQVNFKGVRHTVLIRYMGTYYPERATQAVGLVLNKEWLIKQVPAIMDSLARENQAILFMAPAPPDTNWIKHDDPYASPSGVWKETIGIRDSKDTLWWYGDPNVKIGHGINAKTEMPGYSVPIGPFGLEVLVKTEFPELQSDIMAGVKIVKWLIPTLLILLQGILILLLILFQSALVKSRRNRIALAHLAHSVKTPVARLKLVTDTLTTERVTSPEEERALIGAVGRECDRLDRAVQNAALSLQKGRRRYNIVPGDLAATVREVADSWRPSFLQADITFDADADGEAEGRKVMANYDSQMISVALDNLLDNALRHTRLNILKPGSQAIRGTHPQVRLSLQHIDNIAITTIDDSGGGIPKSERKKIFKRFGRSSRDPATGATGLGLGLALVKEIVDAHRGSVRVEDSPLGGARFIIELPLV